MGLFDLFKEKKVRTTTNVNTSNTKVDIMKMMLQDMMQKTPSEYFASGAVFDITRQNHDSFAQIINSNDVMSLNRFFINAYVTFCNQPQIVGFTPSMVDVRQNDTNPGTWNADIVNLPSGEKAALCFMPIKNEVFTARIIGIVLGNSGDRYYYCMLNKDDKMFSDVIQNKAMLGIEKIGSIKGLGFELMNSFVECIKNNS